MTFVFGTSARVWLDGLQAACAINDITLQAELDEAEVTTLCSTLKDYIPGLAEVTVEMEGLFDTNTASPATTLESWLSARLGVTFPLVFAPDGGADTGDPAYMMNGFLQDFSVENTVDEAASMELTFRGTSGLSRGRMIQPQITQTATDADGVTFFDNGAATTLGGTAVLSVSAVSGTTPTLAVKLQHSADNITYVDLPGGAFSSQNAINAELITFTGTVNRYLRAVWTIGGTTPSFTFNVGVKRN